MDSCLWNPQKFFTDNGGALANSEFLEMADHLGITVHTTAAESPWSNGAVEKTKKTPPQI